MVTIYDQALNVLKVVNERRKHQVIVIAPTVASEPLPVTASKFGGVPYLPEGVDAPTNSNGDPLGMIAQINCAELPDNNVYPKVGMVQFWIDPTHDFWGADFAEPTSQDNARVVYYEELGVPNPDACAPCIPRGRDWPIVPAGAEFSLECTVVEQGAAEGIPLMCDVLEEFYDDFVNQWNAMYPHHVIESFDDIDNFEEDVTSSVRERIADGIDTHKLGGYPSFFQSDPRYGREDLARYTVNLLTFDYGCWGYWRDPNKIEISWRDGSANWLITPEQLAARDFSQVLFEWAC